MSDGNDRSDQNARLVSASARIYRKLLWAYPEEFRWEYTEEMARYFRELCVDSLREGGIPALLTTWMRTLLELVRSVRVERKQIMPQIEKDTQMAVIASSTWPGCGQLYNGHTIKAVIQALLSLALLTAFFVLGILSQITGMWIVFVIGATLWAYSVIDALLEARRINAYRHDS